MCNFSAENARRMPSDGSRGPNFPQKMHGGRNTRRVSRNVSRDKIENRREIASFVVARFFSASMHRWLDRIKSVSLIKAVLMIIVILEDREPWIRVYEWFAIRESSRRIDREDNRVQNARRFNASHVSRYSSIYKNFLRGNFTTYVIARDYFSLEIYSRFGYVSNGLMSARVCASRRASTVYRNEYESIFHFHVRYIRGT